MVMQAFKYTRVNKYPTKTYNVVNMRKIVLVVFWPDVNFETLHFINEIGLNSDVTNVGKLLGNCVRINYNYEQGCQLFKIQLKDAFLFYFQYPHNPICAHVDFY